MIPIMGWRQDKHAGGGGGGGGGNNRHNDAPQSSGGVFWLGEDGNVWVKGAGGTHSAGRWDGNTTNYWQSRGFSFIPNPNPSRRGGGGYVSGGGGFRGGFGGGGGYSAPAKKLDQDQINSLNGLLGVYDAKRNTQREKARLTHDAHVNEKQEERTKEKKKYDGKKLSTMQDFGMAKNDTDINTRNTLEGLISSLSTMGVGGSRALARRILSSANRSNRQANATYAKNSQALDTAWNEFDAANRNDLAKIEDQYKYDLAEADKEWGQNRQNTLYKMADVYNAADNHGERTRLMNEGNGLNGYISNARFVNPQYTGKLNVMAAPELSSYSQDIAKYDTSAIGNDGTELINPDGTTTPGNLAIKAVAMSDKDLGVKKRIEGEDPVYGV
nr:MAG TPA: hypothetical protein [Caudoviricetes sp.]